MERLKKDRPALVLFIITLVMLVVYIIGFGVLFGTMDADVEAARQALANQGYDQATIELTIRLSVSALYFGIVVACILLLFTVLCGLRCSLHGRWRIGAIVFGVLLIIDGIWTGTQSGSTLVSFLNLGIAITYLVSAVMCKAEVVKTEPKTIDVVEERDEN